MAGRYPSGKPPWGCSPNAPGAPPGAPGCLRDLETNAKIPQKYIEKLHAPRYPKF